VREKSGAVLRRGGRLHEAEKGQSVASEGAIYKNFAEKDEYMGVHGRGVERVVSGRIVGTGVKREHCMGKKKNLARIVSQKERRRNRPLYWGGWGEDRK